jgi:nitrogen-specific signal transduction histidine kinase
MDKEPKHLTPEKIELLKIIGDEILNRLRSIKAIKDLKNSVMEIRQTHKKMAHDIRGPIGGIIGLAQIIAEQGDKNKLEERCWKLSN